ncbi:hypothetical protein M407DRAFT_245978 [Tulasnella calospora MUT 4182]|uniref:Uncharacterized protein n=1 Tax=Tulasnella calospora MUT 4182 TaxID=1051891 RepID=A0A0C3Q7I1_9AGAM|nr:hypothetical protein M407DRAFT_245978 [Tulasnella calospora MUT 4182]
MVFEANDNFQSGAIPEISQPASIQRAWDEFKFDIENLQVQHDLTRFRDPEHHWCYHSSR